MTYFSDFIIFLSIIMFVSIVVSGILKLKIYKISFSYFFIMMGVDVITTEVKISENKFDVMNVLPLLIFLVLVLLKYFIETKSENSTQQNKRKIIIFNLTLCVIITIGYVALSIRPLYLQQG